MLVHGTELVTNDNLRRMVIQHYMMVKEGEFWGASSNRPFLRLHSPGCPLMRVEAEPPRVVV